MQADILRFLRLSKNLNQEVVAEAIGLHQSAYSELESGKKKMNPAIAENLAVYYNVTKEIFLTDSQPIINNNNGDHSKRMSNSEPFYEFEKEMLQAIMQRSEQFMKQLEDERKELLTERKQLLELFNKIVENSKK